MADGLVTVGYAGTGNKTNVENWRRLLHHLPQGTFEIYCHPAYPDATLRQWAGYCDERMKELSILRRDLLCSEARTAGVALINFSDI